AELHDAVTLRFTNGAIGTMAGASGHLGSADNRHAVELRAMGSKGQFHLDLRDNVLWRYRAGGDEVRVPLESDAGLYNCQGPGDDALDPALARSPSTTSPAEPGARTVDILAPSYRSAASGVLESVKTLDR